MNNLLDKSTVKGYVLAGDAILTLQSGNTGEHRTYRVVKDKKQDSLYRVYSLYGDNTKDYRFIGLYYKDDKFYPESRYDYTHSTFWPTTIRVIAFFFNRIDDLPEHLLAYHNGRCSRCGRILTTPESIKRGLGPECYRRSKI